MQSVARFAALFALLLSVPAVVGCTTTGQGSGALPGQRPSVAFESIDGPPPAVFTKLVQKLNEEAEARQVPVVTREGYAPYRVRGYYAVGIVKQRTFVSWVWDVYDAQARRTLRLSGEEKGPPLKRNEGWNAASDEMLSRLARQGMDQLLAFIGSPGRAPSAPPPDYNPDRPAEQQQVAVFDDFRPEAAGIFRLFGGQQAGQEGSAAFAEGDVALPRRRPIGPRDRVALAQPVFR